MEFIFTLYELPNHPQQTTFKSKLNINFNIMYKNYMYIFINEMKRNEKYVERSKMMKRKNETNGGDWTKSLVNGEEFFWVGFSTSTKLSKFHLEGIFICLRRSKFTYFECFRKGFQPRASLHSKISTQTISTALWNTRVFFRNLS